MPQPAELRSVEAIYADLPRPGPPGADRLVSQRANVAQAAILTQAASQQIRQPSRRRLPRESPGARGRAPPGRRPRTRQTKIVVSPVSIDGPTSSKGRTARHRRSRARRGRRRRDGDASAAASALSWTSTLPPMVHARWGRRGHHRERSQDNQEHTAAAGTPAPPARGCLRRGESDGGARHHRRPARAGSRRPCTVVRRPRRSATSAREQDHPEHETLPCRCRKEREGGRRAVRRPLSGAQGRSPRTRISAGHSGRCRRRTIGPGARCLASARRCCAGQRRRRPGI